jgi:undecaprenyl-diphosphatase
MSFNHFLQILLLAIVQGAAELLPISSSAHVIVVAKLIRYDVTKSPFEFYFLMVMLHTGTMFSVLVYFQSRWKRLVSDQWRALVVATLCTGAIGYPLMLAIKHVLNAGSESAHPQEVEHLFQNLPLMACALAIVGVLIIIAGRKDEKWPAMATKIGLPRAAIIGAVQGLALPFRGFSRSGSTISAGMLSGIARLTAEEFSFALAVIITPAVIAREVLMVLNERSTAAAAEGGVQAALSQLFFPGLVGMGLSFVAGLLALRWLSSWLERGRWKYFGIYCLVAAAVVLVVHFVQR